MKKKMQYMQSQIFRRRWFKSGKVRREFAELDGWNAEAEEQLLNDLGIPAENHYKKMSELKQKKK